MSQITEVANSFNPNDEGPTGNLIVNYLPTEADEVFLRALFGEHGIIQDVKVVRDKVTKKSLGYGFVKFLNVADAANAVNAKNHMKVGDKEIKVSFARKSSSMIRNAKIIVVNLPLDVTHAEVYNLFAPYGEVIECRVVNRRQNSLEKICFIQFANRVEAESALQVNRTTFRGCVLSVTIAQSLTTKGKDSPLLPSSDDSVYVLGSGSSNDVKSLNEQLQLMKLKEVAHLQNVRSFQQQHAMQDHMMKQRVEDTVSRASLRGAASLDSYEEAAYRAQMRMDNHPNIASRYGVFEDRGLPIRHVTGPPARAPVNSIPYGYPDSVHPHEVDIQYGDLRHAPQVFPRGRPDFSLPKGVSIDSAERHGAYYYPIRVESTMSVPYKVPSDDSGERFARYSQQPEPRVPNYPAIPQANYFTRPPPPAHNYRHSRSGNSNLPLAGSSGDSSESYAYFPTRESGDTADTVDSHSAFEWDNVMAGRQEDPRLCVRRFSENASSTDSADHMYARDVRYDHGCSGVYDKGKIPSGLEMIGASPKSVVAPSSLYAACATANNTLHPQGNGMRIHY